MANSDSSISRWRSAGALLVALNLLPAPARSAQPLAVFIQGGRSYSTDNRARSAENQRARARADVAVGEVLPGLELGGSYTHQQREIAVDLPGGDRLTLQPRNQVEAALRLRVPLVDVPGYYRVSAAQNLAEASRALQSSTQLEVDRQVSASYFEHEAAGALHSSAQKSVESALANLRFVEDLLSAGRTTDLERERAVANLERARQDEADAQLAIALTSRRLLTLSGVTATPPTPPPAQDLSQEPPLGSFLSRVDSTPANAAARATTAAARDAHAAARARLLPTLTGVARERLVAPAFGGHHDGYALLLLLDFRLDYALLAQRRVSAAEVDLAVAEHDAVRRRVADAIHDAYRRVESLIVKCQAARAQAKAAERAAVLAAARFEAGKATQLDVTQAQRDAFLADASRIQADASLAYARVALRLAAGLPLPPPTSNP